MALDAKRADSLKRLFERHRALAEGERNLLNSEKWRGNGQGKHPDGEFLVFLGCSYISRAFGVDMRDYFTDPGVYLEANMRMAIKIFERFGDDAPLTKTIAYHPGVTMEPSLFGVEAMYQSDKEPWEKRDAYILEDASTLSSLSEPDFYTCGPMRKIHDMYGRLCEIVQTLAPDYAVSFPEWKRSPFGVACSLRGMERISLDFYDDPEFVHRLLSFLVRAQLGWEKARESFLGEKGRMRINNDEVNCPMVSPHLYEHFILPYEKELREYYGSLDYFHSCGNLTPLIPLIKTMEPRVFHVSPWTGLREACAAFEGTGTVLQVWAHVSDDVMNASGADARAAMAERAEICRAHDIAGFYFLSGNIQQTGPDTGYDDGKILQWARACRLAKTATK